MRRHRLDPDGIAGWLEDLAAQQGDAPGAHALELAARPLRARIDGETTPQALPVVCPGCGHVLAPRR